MEIDSSSGSKIKQGLIQKLLLLILLISTECRYIISLKKTYIFLFKKFQFALTLL